MHISRHWRRADHGSGTVVAKNIAIKQTLEILLVRHRSSCTEISIQRPALEKQSIILAAGIEIARATTQLREAQFIQNIM